MQHRQSGFSALEIIMVVVIIGLVGAVGWLFWDKQVNKTDTKSSEVVKISEKSAEKKQQTVNTFNAEAIGIAFDYPSTWTLNDTENYPLKSNSPNDIHKVVQSPSGFSLTFSTLSVTGHGGTGTCPQVTGFENYGESKYDNTYAVIFDDSNGGIVLQLSLNKTKSDQESICTYQDIIRFAEPEYIDDNQYTTKPYAFLFGTFINYEDVQNGKTVQKPNDKELKEAISILRSTRKI